MTTRMTLAELRAQKERARRTRPGSPLVADRPTSEPVRLVLPPPISLNNVFRNVSARENAARQARGLGKIGRKKTEAYASWMQRAAQMLSAQGPIRTFSVPVRITYYVGEHGVGNMDIGNTEKAATDALVKAGVLQDDSRKWLRAVHPIWTPHMGGIVAVIEVVEAEPRAAEIVAMVRQKGMLEVRS